MYVILHGLIVKKEGPNKTLHYSLFLSFIFNVKILVYDLLKLCTFYTDKVSIGILIIIYEIFSKPILVIFYVGICTFFELKPNHFTGSWFQVEKDLAPFLVFCSKGPFMTIENNEILHFDTIYGFN